MILSLALIWFHFRFLIFVLAKQNGKKSFEALKKNKEYNIHLCFLQNAATELEDHICPEPASLHWLPVNF